MSEKPATREREGQKRRDAASGTRHAAASGYNVRASSVSKLAARRASSKTPNQSKSDVQAGQGSLTERHRNRAADEVNRRASGHEHATGTDQRPA